MAVDASDRDALMAELISRGFIVLEVQEQTGSKTSFNLLRRVSHDELFVFTKQLLVLVRAGIPMVQVLDILSEDMANSHFRKVISSLAEGVDSGESLSEAMMRHSEIFSPIYIHTVKAGERGSRLEEVLQKLIEYQAVERRLRSKVVNSLIYPVILMVASGCIVLFLIGYVVPTFARVFADLGAQLPYITSMMMKFSNILKASFPFMVPAAVIIAIAYSTASRLPFFGLLIDRFKLSVPIFGGIVERMAILRFCQVLKLLIDSGVPLVDAIRTVSEAVSNKDYSRKFSAMAESVSIGNNLSEAMKETGIGKGLLSRLIRVGERSSDLPAMLDSISELYGEALETRVELLVSMLEPALLLVMGAIACVILLSLFLPVFQMATVVR